MGGVPAVRPVKRRSPQAVDQSASTRPARFASWRSINALLVGIPLVLAGCSVAPPQTLRIGSNLWPGYETLYLARDLDYYKDKPIKLVDYPSGTEEVRAYRNKEIDGAGLSIDQALVLASTQGDIRIIAVMDFSDGGDVILGQPGIGNFKDLKDRRIGVESTALGAFFLSRALEKNGMSAQDVKIVSLELADHERAFTNQEVDAVVTFGPARSRLLKAGARQLFDSSSIPGEIVDTLVVSTDAIKTNPKAVQALVDGRFKALGYFERNPEQAASLMAKRTQVTPAQLLEAFQGLKQPSLADNQALLSQKDPTLVLSMQKLIDVMIKNRLIDKRIDPRTLLDDRFVNSVASYNHQ
ncbi:ABC transporter substrate-binding protein [Synechococcus sp. CBW1107]|uniref:ABC transporter substrate-binding protein n=1 Tax=Synechococcus sp. CBW1107 TaxID=2789857 RepID=UPI002AD353F1|nr:ABC transporter substrate-binding protein [Synechococcus sp. CBW1107]CAK6690581.1 Putative aliphatic sulfonates-binding protein [Synechococcus sp. CBW1107]